MEKIKNWLIKNPGPVTIVLVVFYSVGIAGLSLEWSRNLFRMLVPLTLLMSYALLIFFHENRYREFVVYNVLLYLSSFALEAVGTNTGIVFGEYSYGPTLGFAVFHTPVIIGVNWIILTYAIWSWVGQKKWNFAVKVVTAALLMVAYDIVLEPVAISLDMWSWTGGDIPLQNYLAWFVFSLLVFLVLWIFRIRFANRIAIPLFLVQLVFFAVLNLTL